MTEYCAVHRTLKNNGVCYWCLQAGGSDPALDGRDDKLKGAYDAKTGLVAKPTKLDQQVAEYEDPWAPAFFQAYMDFQPAPGLHRLEQRTTGFLIEYHHEWGEMAIRGERASAVELDVIGWVRLGVDERGDPTAALTATPDQRTISLTDYENQIGRKLRPTIEEL